MKRTVATIAGFSVVGGVWAGDVLSTRQVGQPTEWSNVSRWMNEPSAPTFPNNGNEGHTFDVVIPGTTVKLDLPIEIDSLNILGVVEHDGFTLDVLGPVIASFGTFENGTLSASSLSASSNITLDGATATANLLTLNGNAGLSLRESSNLTLNGNGNDTIVLIGDGDIGQTGAPSLLTMPNSGVIRKFSGNGLSEIRVPITTDALTVISQSGGVKFDLSPQSWSELTLTAKDGGTIEFADSLTVNDISVSGEGGQTGTVTIRSLLTLGGTLTTANVDTNQDVLITGSPTMKGIVSGGVLNGSFNFPVALDGAG